MGTGTATGAKEYRSVSSGTVRRNHYERGRLRFSFEALRQAAGGRSGFRKTRAGVGPQGEGHSRVAGANRHSTPAAGPARPDRHLPRILSPLPWTEGHVAAAAVAQGDPALEPGRTSGEQLV